jgi:sulfur carrier protein ThiS
LIRQHETVEIASSIMAGEGLPSTTMLRAAGQVVAGAPLRTMTGMTRRRGSFIQGGSAAGRGPTRNDSAKAPYSASVFEHGRTDTPLMQSMTSTAGRIHVTLKLYASLTQYLPDAFRRGHAMPLEVDAAATIESLVAPLGMPPALVKLVVLNGVFVPPSQRASQRFADGDVLAIWPPVAGG